MRRSLAWLGGALGLAALLRLRREKGARSDAGEPAERLREKLAQARGAGDDRDEFDAAEGQPVDEVDRPAPGQPRSIEERRRAIHEQAQQALGEMNRSDPGE